MIDLDVYDVFSGLLVRPLQKIIATIYDECYTNLHILNQILGSLRFFKGGSFITSNQVILGWPDESGGYFENHRHGINH
jgi:hypothetical protein